MPVSNKDDIYKENSPMWKVARDTVAGSAAIKAGKEIYLPRQDGADRSKESDDDYSIYLQRASYINFTGHTKDGFSGMIARKAPVIELDPGLAYLEDNSDGTGRSIFELAMHNINELLEVGRNGFLVDFPRTEHAETSDELAQSKTKEQTNNLEAVFKEYPTESIIKVRERVVDGKKVPIMIVLTESVEKIDPDDEFQSMMVTHYRVLLLENGIYSQKLYDENEQLIEDDIIPRKHDGSTWDFIPFAFSGAINNNADPDKSPLYDIAEISIGHYVNSADFEESCHMMSQPTPVLKGITIAWQKEVLKGSIKFGSKNPIILPVGGDALLLQANANQMSTEGMNLKEHQMVMIGAAIITDRGGVVTAEAEKLRFAGRTSKLGLIVSNTEKTMQKLLEWAGLNMNTNGENIFELNKEFYEATINPQLLVASMQAMDRGIMAKSDVRNHMRKSSIIAADRTDEEIDAEAEKINPLT